MSEVVVSASGDRKRSVSLRWKKKATKPIFAAGALSTLPEINDRKNPRQTSGEPSSKNENNDDEIKTFRLNDTCDTQVSAVISLNSRACVNKWTKERNGIQSSRTA